MPRCSKKLGNPIRISTLFNSKSRKPCPFPINPSMWYFHSAFSSISITRPFSANAGGYSSTAAASSSLPTFRTTPSSAYPASSAPPLLSLLPPPQTSSTTILLTSSTHYGMHSPAPPYPSTTSSPHWRTSGFSESYCRFSLISINSYSKSPS